MQSQQRGQQAENLALAYLQKQGYSLIQRNYRRRFGEIDLVMRQPDDPAVVFVEVRFRQHTEFGGAVASVDRRKQRKLVRTVNLWLQRHADSLTQARLDVIAVGVQPASDESVDFHGYWVDWIINAVEDDD